MQLTLDVDAEMAATKRFSRQECDEKKAKRLTNWML
jgi:hypothetical protein